MSSMLSIIHKKNSDKVREEYYKSIQDFHQSQYELKSKQFESKSISKMASSQPMPRPTSSSKLRGNSYNLFQQQEGRQQQGIDQNLIYNLNRINQNPGLAWGSLQRKASEQRCDEVKQERNKDNNVTNIIDLGGDRGNTQNNRFFIF